VRAREATGAKTVFAQQTLDKPSGAGLAVSARDVDDAVDLLRVSEQLNQPSSWVKARADLVFRNTV
jgi:hypothetical protein